MRHPDVPVDANLTSKDVLEGATAPLEYFNPGDPRRDPSEAWNQFWKGFDRFLTFPTFGPTGRQGFAGASIEERLDISQEASLGLFPLASGQRIGNAFVTGDFSKVTVDDMLLTALALLPGVAILRGPRGLSRAGLALEAYMRSYRIPFLLPGAAILRGRIWVSVAYASPHVGLRIARGFLIKRLIYIFGPVVGPKLSLRILRMNLSARQLLAFEYVLSKVWFNVVSPPIGRIALTAFLSRDEVRDTLVAPFRWLDDPRNVYDIAIDLLRPIAREAGVPAPLYDLITARLREEIPSEWPRGVPVVGETKPEDRFAPDVPRTAAERKAAFKRAAKAGHRAGKPGTKAYRTAFRAAYKALRSRGTRSSPKRGRLSTRGTDAELYSDTGRRDRWNEGAYAQTFGYGGANAAKG